MYCHHYDFRDQYEHDDDDDVIIIIILVIMLHSVYMPSHYNRPHIRGTDCSMLLCTFIYVSYTEEDNCYVCLG